MKSVSLPYENDLERIEWIKINCPSYIGNNLKAVETNMDPVEFKYGGVVQFQMNIIDTQYLIEYHFSDEEDTVLFKLRWS